MKFFQNINHWDNDTKISISIILIGFIMTLFISFVDLFTLYPQFNFSWIYLLYIILWFMSFVCYYKCVTTNTEVPEITKMDISTYPPCSKCGLGKPERAHHCSKCKSCILEMDHHCNYIGNCVGFANKKYFLLLLFYVTLMILFVLLINTPLAIYAFFYPLRNPFYHCVFRLFDLVHCILGIYALTLIASTAHVVIKGLLCNYTTIEFIVKGEMGWISSSESRRKNKYDLGTLRNIQQVFGIGLLQALLPIPSNTTCNGINFETNGEYNEALENQYNEYYEDY
ncbi:hypothetical protein conserved domain containing [Entamoeba histolytica]|nr:hypothetical protein conserved domain containing [Entamoeba histolytica]